MQMKTVAKPTRLNGLDGFRALLALIILWGHIPQVDFCEWGEAMNSLFVRFPPCCAYLFLVLSGFLAGYKSRDRVSARSYYLRRAKKILPLYYGYIIVTILAFWFLGRVDEVVNPNLLYYVFLVPSLPFCTSSGTLPLVHLWFVGTVVLFYLTFPLFMRVKDDAKPEVAISLAVTWALLKWSIYLFVGKDTFIYRFVSVTAFDCMYLGVFLGCAVKERMRWAILISKNQVLASVVWMLFLLSGLYGSIIPAPARIEYMALLGALLILNQVSSRPVLSLENKVMNYLGGISYEIYVVQILVIMLLSMLYVHAGWHWPLIVIFLLCTVAVVGVAKCSSLLLSKRGPSFLFPG